MKVEIRSADPDDLSAVKTLLIKAFNAAPPALFARDDHLRWKYFQPRADWSEPRGYVCAWGNSFAAFACAWPFHLSLNGLVIDGSHPIDWAATNDIPGAGALLLRHMRTLGQLSCCLGGTDVAQKVIAQSGYKPAGEIKYYARPLDAFRQAITHQRRNWKLPARFVRNAIWSYQAGTRIPPAWAAHAIAPEDLPNDVFPRSSAKVTACHRTAAQFRYLQGCPVAPHRLYLTTKNNHPSGYFLLSTVPGQMRIADAWVQSESSEDWAALYQLAVRMASQTPGVAEITTSSAIAVSRQALEQIGFKVYSTLPILFFDPKKLLAGAPPLHLQMIDNDFSFLNSGQPYYET